ncbi:CPBP family intramembrane glutamic endopeptidase [Paenibacillus dendritiformis]|uniref:CPBP family intramembrane glutamic endopeptidase n=1 Tax=Paenibacillus dendritiformis TaxID=130049 RepID=UPI0018CCF3CE|nr:CPBP family intramembrane glutamic endopeptidase [Paenibacillus dendritiformis]
MLRFADKLTWKETLTYLGFRRESLKGLLLVLPLITLLFTALSLPYMKWVFPSLSSFLNSIPALHMGERHIFNQGYYDFPWPLLLIGIIGNFIGEEVYFRGYLLKKIGRLRFDWLILSILFQFYHMWQAPMNWAFIPLAVIIPCEILVKLRKNIYGAILFHIFVNTIWGLLPFIWSGCNSPSLTLYYRRTSNLPICRRRLWLEQARQSSCAAMALSMKFRSKQKAEM